MLNLTEKISVCLKCKNSLSVRQELICFGVNKTGFCKKFRVVAF